MALVAEHRINEWIRQWLIVILISSRQDLVWFDVALVDEIRLEMSRSIGSQFWVDMSCSWTVSVGFGLSVAEDLVNGMEAQNLNRAVVFLVVTVVTQGLTNREKGARGGRGCPLML